MIECVARSKRGATTFIIDREDAWVLSVGKVCISGDGKYILIGGKYIHRIILGAKKGEIVDHANMNTYDNRRFNLRITNKSGNELNKKKRAGPHGSKYKGVVFKKEASRRLKWCAKITINKKNYHIGHYETEVEAAIAYNNFGIKNAGKCFRPNLIPKAELNTVGRIRPTSK